MFEHDVLDTLLSGDAPALAALRGQLPHLKVTNRERTDVGVFTEFVVDPVAPSLPIGERFVISEVAADIEGLEYGAAFAVFVEEGRLAMLEGFTLGPERWPEEVGRYRLYFINEPRNLGLPLVT